VDWEEILLDGFQVGSGARDLSEAETFERVNVQTRDLIDQLRDQLQMLELTDRQRLLAEEFLGNIGEDGYLHATLDEIVQDANKLVRGWISPNGGGPEVAEAAEIAEDVAELAGVAEERDAVAQSDGAMEAAEAAEGAEGAQEQPALPGLFTVAEAEELLHVLQQLDPPGIAARDLRECILLQLEDACQQETLTYKLVHEAFDDLIAHRWSDLAKRYAIDPREVQDAADQLAKLDPKPGLRFLPSDDEYVTPDLIVEKIDGEYMVFVNDTSLPRLRISRAYREVAKDKRKFTGENKEFISSKLNSANWMIQAIEQRRQTMLKVMNFIVDRQREFFERGVQYLRPLTLREVADYIEMHESTVSRVTNQKYVQTPRGVFSLKYFFSSGLSTTSGEDISARGVKDKIHNLVSGEDTKKPLTDQAIVKVLKSEGVNIARRTVAKYRDQLGILPARMRKRV
jgi:RNA polymerase sigma-54 factor